VLFYRRPARCSFLAYASLLLARRFHEAVFVTAGHLAPTLGEPVPSQPRGDTWIRVMGGRIQSVRNGHWLSRGKYVLLTHISNHSGGDPLVIAP